jgi:hypothetical protein
VLRVVSQARFPAMRGATQSAMNLFILSRIRGTEIPALLLLQS